MYQLWQTTWNNSGQIQTMKEQTYNTSGQIMKGVTTWSTEGWGAWCRGVRGPSWRVSGRWLGPGVLGSMLNEEEAAGGDGGEAAGWNSLQLVGGVSIDDMGWMHGRTMCNTCVQMITHKHVSDGMKYEYYGMRIWQIIVKDHMDWLSYLLKNYTKYYFCNFCIGKLSKCHVVTRTVPSFILHIPGKTMGLFTMAGYLPDFIFSVQFKIF